jgi:hypothetical protein
MVTRRLYYDHPATIHPLDQAIYQSVKAGVKPDLLPIYGCAIQ